MSAKDCRPTILLAFKGFAAYIALKHGAIHQTSFGTDTPSMTDEINYRILKLLEAKPDISQRELAKGLGVSLGKTNYCLKAMLEKGWIKARNFKNSSNKIAYTYFLTPKGIESRAKLTVRFLTRKMREYDLLKYEIERLQQEVFVLNNSKTENTKKQNR